MQVCPYRKWFFRCKFVWLIFSFVLEEFCLYGIKSDICNSWQRPLYWRSKILKMFCLGDCMRRILSVLASGILLERQYQLLDIDNETNLFNHLTPNQRHCITYKAQQALRYLTFRVSLTFWLQFYHRGHAEILPIFREKLTKKRQEKSFPWFLGWWVMRIPCTLFVLSIS